MSIATPAFFELTEVAVKDWHALGHIEVHKARASHRVGPATQCPQCGGYVEMLRWLPPLRVSIDVYGTTLPEVALPAGRRDLLVSRRLADWMKAAGVKGLTGWEPVEVTNVTPDSAMFASMSFVRIEIPLVMHRIDDAKSHAVRPDASACALCGGGRLERIGKVYMQEPAPHTLDMFRPFNYGSAIIVNRRVADSLAAVGMTGARLVPCGNHIK